ncbi:splicing factor 3A subunit 2-like [Leopardus geoffroyi]|uniref:splicing factor 3A subunit 2-like n=1 Tax=Leopardus geoffroyi TaxID=46844 RepID=UPI001E2622CD|nr:splicing factor 3A subunit 2-like [Leopardus geoffroyi]
MHPVLPDSQDLLSLDPLPYQIPPLIPQATPIPAPDPIPPAPAEPPVAQPIEELENRVAQPAPMPSGGGVQGPAGHTRRRAPHEPGLRLPDSTVALPLWEIGPPNDTGNPRLQYWPFSTSDLYNWKTQNARFSDNPKDLIALLDSVMFTDGKIVHSSMME